MNDITNNVRENEKNMLNTLQTHAPTISILLLVALLIALLLAPNATQILSTAILLFGIGTAVFFTVQGNREKKEEKDLSQSEFFRNTFLDLLGLALVMGLAMWLGRMAGNYAGQNWGMFAGIAAGMAVGFGVGFLVQKGWGRVAKPL